MEYIGEGKPSQEKMEQNARILSPGRIFQVPWFVRPRPDRGGIDRPGAVNFGIVKYLIRLKPFARSRVIKEANMQTMPGREWERVRI